jgi:hypothetical protein
MLKQIDGKSAFITGSLMLAAAIIYVYIFDSKLAVIWDNWIYYILGESLAQGRGYTDLSGNPHTHFPPGYPSIIALAMFFSGSIVFIKIVNGILFISMIPVLLRIFERMKINRVISIITVSALILNCYLLKMATLMMSEIPFLFFSLLTVYLVMKMDIDRSPLKNPIFYLMLVCLVFSLYIRTLGISLVLAVMFYFAFQRKWKYLLLTGLFSAAAFTPWIVYMINSNIESSYVKYILWKDPKVHALGYVGITDIVVRILQNLRNFVGTQMPDALFPFLHKFIFSSIYPRRLLSLLIFLTMIFGLFQIPRKRALVFSYLGLTYAIILAWPVVWTDSRFLYPILPFLLLLFLSGLNRILELLVDRMKPWKKPGTGAGSQWLRYKPHYLGVLLLLYLPTIFVLHNINRGPHPPVWDNVFNAAKWLKENSLPEAVLCSQNPEMLYIVTGRSAVYFQHSTNHSTVIQSLAGQKVDYVLVDELPYEGTRQFLVPTIEKYPQKFEEVLRLEEPRTIVYKFNKR